MRFSFPARRFSRKTRYVTSVALAIFMAANYLFTFSTLFNTAYAEGEESTTPAENISGESATVPAETTVLPAEEATPQEEVTITEEPQVPEQLPVWTEDNGTYTTTEPVDLRPEGYQALGVTITFTSLPAVPGHLSISEVNAPETINGAEVVSKAYEIISTMTDGTFEYTLSLPKPEVEESQPLEIVYSEDGNSFSELQGEQIQRNDVVVDDLTHFTVFVIVSPASAQQFPDGSGVWNNVNRVYSSDNQRATVSLWWNQRSNTLIASDFGMAIPAGATIEGVTVEIERSVNQWRVLGARDYSVKLVKGGVPVGSNYASSQEYPLIDAYRTYGSSNDLWGTTWTPSDFNASNFGVALVTHRPMFALIDQTARVDHIRVTVAYNNVTVIYPNGGEVFAGGSTQSVSWSTDNTDGDPISVTLEYSLNNGLNYTTIASGLPGIGTYPWTVPSVNTNQALVRAFANDGTSIATDTSDNTFTIDSLAPTAVWLTPVADNSLPLDCATEPHATTSQCFANQQYIKTLQAHVEDTNGIASVTFWFHDQRNGTDYQIGTAVDLGGGNYSTAFAGRPTMDPSVPWADLGGWVMDTQLQVVVTDSAGHVTTTPIDVKIDNYLPTIQLNSTLINQAVADNTLDVTGTINDPSQMANGSGTSRLFYTIIGPDGNFVPGTWPYAQITGIPNATGTPLPFDIDLDLSSYSMSDGIYWILVAVNDYAWKDSNTFPHEYQEGVAWCGTPGNPCRDINGAVSPMEWWRDGVYPFVVDTTDPTATWTTPTADTLLPLDCSAEPHAVTAQCFANHQDAKTLQAHVEDNIGIYSVEFQFFDQRNSTWYTIGTATDLGGGNYSTVFAGRPSMDPSVPWADLGGWVMDTQLQVIVTDFAGYSVLIPVDVKIDNYLPTISLNSTLLNQYINANDNTLDILGTINDPAQMAGGSGTSRLFYTIIDKQTGTFVPGTWPYAQITGIPNATGTPLPLDIDLNLSSYNLTDGIYWILVAVNDYSWKDSNTFPHEYQEGVAWCGTPGNPCTDIYGHSSPMEWWRDGVYPFVIDTIAPEVTFADQETNEIVTEWPSGLEILIPGYSGDLDLDSIECTAETIFPRSAEDGAFTVTCEFMDYAGNEGEATYEVTINNVAPTATINANPGTNVVQGTVVTLTANVSSGNEPFSYLWTGDCSGTGITTIAPTATIGPKTCNLQVTDADGDIANSTIVITVAAVQGAVIAPPDEDDGQDGGDDGNGTGNETDTNPSVSITPTDPEVATDEEVTLTANVTSGEGPYTYSWTCTNGMTGTGSTIVFKSATAGEFTCTVKVIDVDGDEIEASTNVTVGSVEGAEDENGKVAGASDEGDSETRVCFWWWLLGIVALALNLGFVVVMAEKLEEEKWRFGIPVVIGLIAFLLDKLMHTWWTPSSYCHWMWVIALITVIIPVALWFVIRPKKA